MRLRWTGDDTNSNERKMLRRTLDFVQFPPSQLFDTYEELDDALNKLNSRDRPTSRETALSGPFGVFANNNEDMVSPASSVSPVATLSTDSGPSPLRATEPDISLWEALAPEFDMRSIFAQGIAQSSLHSETEPLLFEVNRNDEGLIVLESDTARKNLVLTTQANYLFRNYERMVPLMSFVSHSKNAWSTIYCPHVRSAIGDMSVSGETSYARQTLLHSVAAISAYHLRLETRVESKKMSLGELSARLHTAALWWLNKCLDEHDESHYKDLLLALYSIVQYDFTTNDESAAGVTCEALQRLISSRIATRPKVSHKASVLHRICGWTVVLRKLIEVTGSFSNHERTELQWLDQVFANSPLQPVQGLEDLAHMESRQKPLNEMNSFTEFDYYIREYIPRVSVENTERREAVSSLVTFGVPESLILLLREAVVVSRYAYQERTNGKFSETTSLGCASLEAALASWPEQFARLRPDEPLDRKKASIVMHHALAFYESLVVYHYRVAKDVPPSLLQAQLVRTINHLEAITRVNREDSENVCIPYLFTGFICACEVAEDDASLRNRYDLWFQDMRALGLSSYQTAIKVVQEVHKRRKEGVNCDWWDIQQDWGIMVSLYF